MTLHKGHSQIIIIKPRFMSTGGVFSLLTLRRVRDCVYTPTCFKATLWEKSFAAVTNLTAVCWYSAGQAFEHRPNAWSSFLIRSALPTHDALLCLSSRILWPLNILVRDSHSCNYLLYLEIWLPSEFSFKKFILRFTVDSRPKWFRAYLTSFYFQRGMCGVANFLSITAI